MRHVHEEEKMNKEEVKNKICIIFLHEGNRIRRYYGVLLVFEYNESVVGQNIITIVNLNKKIKTKYDYFLHVSSNQLRDKH
jgi:hypothetical protein